MQLLHLSSVCLALVMINAGTNLVTATTCASRVSTGDQCSGISAVEDATCVSGGLGCFPGGEECRFCKVVNTTESEHLLPCSEVLPSATYSSNSSTNGTKESAEAGAVDCASLVSIGDSGVGISAVSGSSPSCSTNGLGCFKDGQCRFCQKWSTPQSGAFMKCSTLGGSSTSTTTPTATVASTSTSCSTVVASAGLDGISYVSDSRCNVGYPTLLGCSARTSCRLCRNYKNENNQFLVSCKVLKSMGIESAPANAEAAKIDSTTNAVIGQSSAVKMTAKTQELQTINDAAKDTSAISVTTVAAVFAGIIAAVIMSAMYIYKRYNPTYPDIMTPNEGPNSLLTPHDRLPTPRHGSLVMVVSQSSIATL